MQRGSKPRWVRDLALKRIEILLRLAEAEVRGHPQRAKRYVSLACKLSSRYNVTLPREMKRRMCKKCNAFLVPGYNLTVRADRKTKSMLYICKECGARKRYGYSAKRSVKK
jgi:ribonuclease P protein subunit RPR2